MNSAASVQRTSAKPQDTSLLPSAGLLLQRKCSCGGSASSSITGECEECKKKRLQKKLSIGASNDPLEQEADWVADQVLAAPAHSAVGSSPPRIQRFTGYATGDAGTAPASVERVLSGSGRPLDPTIQQDMGHRFGYDFSQVRVYTGAAAEQSVQDVNANAYTVGQNIVFGAGRFTPATQEGRKLIAHELTHVVQQSDLVGIRVAQSDKKRGLSSISHVVQRAEPVTTTAATVTISAVVAKCIIGAITGALFDAAIQAALHSWRQRTWRFWDATLNYCSIILSAILGCIAAPVSAFVLEGWIASKLGSLGGIAGTLIGKILIFIAKKLAIGIPKGIIGKLAKLGCISPEQAAELGMTPGIEAVT